MPKEMYFPFKDGENATNFTFSPTPFKSGVVRDMEFPFAEGETALDYEGGPEPGRRLGRNEAYIEERKLILMLSRCPDPQTGKPFTTEALAQIFNTSPAGIQNRLRKAGRPLRPAPEVRLDQIPENEKSFFIGLTLGDFIFDRRHRSGQDLMIVATRSPNPSRRKMLASSLGTWGTMTGDSILKVNLASPQFDFMQNPDITYDFLDAKRRYAPFLLGALAVRMSNSGRFSTEEEVGRRIHSAYERHFGHSMGVFDVEERRHVENGNRPTRRGVIQITQPQMVFEDVLNVQSVKSLPFLPTILGSNSQNGHHA